MLYFTLIHVQPKSLLPQQLRCINCNDTNYRQSLQIKELFSWPCFPVLSQISAYLTNGNETVQEGGNVSLYCNISGFPKPTITWSKDGEPIDEPEQGSRWLNFIDIKRDKAGNYRCHANNTCGERDSEGKRIDVQCKDYSG